MIKRSLFAVVVALLVVSVAGCGGGAQEEGSGAQEEKPLRVGLVPNQNPEKVEAEYSPLGDYLSEKLGQPVELSVPASYTAVVEAMASGELDLAYFGGLTYVQARDRAEVHPLVTEINPATHDTTYRSVVIVPSDSEVQEVSELRGEDFAFGSVSSTSGSLYPSIMLDEAGIDYRTDLGEITYTGGHDATAQAVAGGRVAAGGIEDRILYRLQDEGAIEKDSVRVIQESEPIQGYPWVIRDELPDETETAIADAYLTMEDPKLLDLLSAEGYERVEAGDYDYVEEQARELDLLTEKK